MQMSDIGGNFEMLLAHPGQAERVIREAAAVRARELASLADLRPGGGGTAPVGGYRVDRRAALIPVVGPLIPRGPVILSRYGVTSYEALRAEFYRAGDDEQVDVIVLMIDSPGGFVRGVDETADAILAVRAKKPVLAVVEGWAASAAYWLAAQSDAIVLPRFGEVGSIGALIVHAEASKALDAAGIKVTIVRAGARKAETNAYEPLSDEALASMQAGVDDARTAFAAAVVAGRAQPGLDLAAVMATEAAMFNARRAVDLGLADHIGTLDQVLATLPALAASSRRPVARSIGLSTLQESPPTRGEAPPASLPAPEHDRAPTPGPPSAAAPADLAGLLAGERERVATIFAHPWAATDAGRAFAESLARSEKSAADAIAEMDRFAAFVAQQEKANARAAVPSLEAEMAADAMPVIGHDGGAPGGMSPMEEGAATAARLSGRDPHAAVAKLRGAPAPVQPGTDETPPAPTMSATSAALLAKLAVGGRT